MDAVRVCSLGQISGALFEVGGKYRRSMWVLSKYSLRTKSHSDNPLKDLNLSSEVVPQESTRVDH